MFQIMPDVQKLNFKKYNIKFFREVSRKNDFEKNRFFSALEQVLPTLYVFNLGFGSYGEKTLIINNFNKNLKM